MLSYAGFHRAARSSHYAGETAAALARSEETIARLKSKAEKAKEAAQHVGQNLMHKAVSAATAGAMGYWQGLGKPMSIKGVPLDLTLGGLALAAALAGELGYVKQLEKAAPYLDDFATGAFAFAAANYGNMAGLKMAQKAPAAAAVAAKGYEGHEPAAFGPHFDAFGADVASETSSVPYGYR